jgi:hypothetical protein
VSREVCFVWGIREVNGVCGFSSPFLTHEEEHMALAQLLKLCSAQEDAVKKVFIFAATIVFGIGKAKDEL